MAPHRPRSGSRDSRRSGNNPWGLANNVARFYALNDDGSLWFNDGLVLDNPGTWRPFSVLPAPAAVPVEISAASPTEAYVLDSAAHLWTVTTPSLPQSVAFQISASQEFGEGSSFVNDFAQGNINISQNGDWSITNAFVELGDRGIGTSIPYTLTCNTAGFDWTWSGSIGENLIQDPVRTLTGSGNDPDLADDWTDIVASFQSSHAAGCTLRVCDIPSAQGGVLVCPGSAR